MKVHILENNIVINSVIVDAVTDVENGIDGSVGGIGWTLVDGELQDLNPEVVPYDVQRKSEYPPIEDYLDGIVKGDQTQVDQYIADCLAIKTKYPKPT
tara:strand:+ start:631 stop:924 length:294 start_codon:yes stop_codon:yes gene_type:complete